MRRRLPREEFLLNERICATSDTAKGHAIVASRARGHLELAALIAAYRKNADALVNARFSLSDPAPEQSRDGREGVTIRELAFSHLVAIGPETLTHDAPAAACRRKLKQTLIALLRD
jgi:hypothetical protein